METLRTSKSEAVSRRIAVCLRHIYEISKDGGYIKVKELLKKHKVNMGLMAYLKRKRIINYNNVTQRYTWLVGEPNLKMAEMIRLEMNKEEVNKNKLNGSKEENTDKWEYPQCESITQIKFPKISLAGKTEEDTITTIADKMLADLGERISREELKELMIELLTEIKQDKKKRLRLRNPFYFKTK